jgi:hypothetical protein
MKNAVYILGLIFGLALATPALALVDGTEVTATLFLNLTADQYVYGYTSDGRLDMGGDFCRMEVAGLGPVERYAINPGMKFKIAAVDTVKFRLDDVATAAHPQVTVSCFRRASGIPDYISFGTITPEFLLKILAMK